MKTDAKKKNSKQNIVDKDQSRKILRTKFLIFLIFVIDKKIVCIKLEFWLRNLLKEKRKEKKRRLLVYRGLNQAPPKLLKFNDGRDKALVHLFKA